MDGRGRQPVSSQEPAAYFPWCIGIPWEQMSVIQECSLHLHLLQINATPFVAQIWSCKQLLFTWAVSLNTNLIKHKYKAQWQLQQHRKSTTQKHSCKPEVSWKDADLRWSEQCRPGPSAVYDGPTLHMRDNGISESSQGHHGNPLTQLQCRPSLPYKSFSFCSSCAETLFMPLGKTTVSDLD